MTTSFEAPIACLLFPIPVTDGLNLAVLISLYDWMIVDPDWHPLPVKLARAQTDGLWRIEDGRHRVIASMMAGRTHVLAVEDGTDQVDASLN